MIKDLLKIICRNHIILMQIVDCRSGVSHQYKRKWYQFSNGKRKMNRDQGQRHALYQELNKSEYETSQTTNL